MPASGWCRAERHYRMFPRPRPDPPIVKALPPARPLSISAAAARLRQPNQRGGVSGDPPIKPSSWPNLDTHSGTFASATESK
jgi:hypothetical protein